MPCYAGRVVSCFVPPQVLQHLLANKDEGVRRAAMATLLTTARLRGERTVRALTAISATPDAGRRSIYDCRHHESLSAAKLARSEDGSPAAANVNAAFEGFGQTRDFYKQVLKRNSIDDRGMRLNGYVNYGKAYQNAFWDGQEMVFGNGDNVIFSDFTGSIDVIAHELTHGVTEYTANLEYHGQSGALNESMSDVFGSLVKQWTRKETAEKANWLIGEGIFTPAIGNDALRSLKAPGTAYDNKLLGKDPQPADMSGYKPLPDDAENDNGGVHLYSGIPNRAFYEVATNIGGFAWEAPGHIWYESLKASTPTTDFQGFADTTFAKAGQLFGPNSLQRKAVADAWAKVGLPIAAAGPAGEPAPVGESMWDLARQIESLAQDIERMSQPV